MYSNGKTPGRKTSDVTGVVFCGGMSRRMGQDKALLENEGQTLLQKACAFLEPHVSQVVLCTGVEPRYSQMGLTCVLDAAPDMGPIGGLQAALSAAKTPWILAMACDLPCLLEDTLLQLLGAGGVGDLAILYGSNARPEPLFALYHRDLLPTVNAAILAGRRRMTSALGLEFGQGPDESSHSPVPIHWLPIPTGKGDPFSNVNRPQDWQQYIQHSAAHQPPMSESKETKS